MDTRVLLCGTGKIYYKYRCKIAGEVVGLLDNNPEKQGLIIDGIEVKSFDSIFDYEYDQIIILVVDNNPIKEQLCDLGVDPKIIYTYQDIGNRISFGETLYNPNEGYSQPLKWFKNNPVVNTRLGIVFPYLGRTGVPTALLNLSMIMKSLSYDVICIAPERDALSKDIEINGIPCIYSNKLYCEEEENLDFLSCFEGFIVGSIILSGVINKLKVLNRPVLWWIHESSDDYIKGNKVYGSDFDNVTLLSGGRRVQNAIKKHFGITNMNELFYSLPDKTRDFAINKKNNVYNFSVLGTIDLRKGQDVFAKAVASISDGRIGASIVGHINDNQLFNVIKDISSEIKFVDEMSQDELDEYYQSIDILVCPSRDDPMPIVVTKAMQYGIPCIVSTEVGQAEFIENGVNGFVFESENYQALAEIMHNILLMDKQELARIGANGREIFDRYFSEDAMKKNLTKILNDVGV